MEQSISPTRISNRIRMLAALGAAWNIFGVVQFSGQAIATPAMLMSDGMTEAQAILYSGLPIWMTVAFGIGVFGGLAGSLLLLAANRLAPAVLAFSLGGYIILFVGDITEGVFAVFGVGQIIILTIVVLIATALLALALKTRRRGQLS